MTLEELGIVNDMPRGWINGKNSPKWHKSLYKRWVHMWNRCKNPQSKDYETYKDCDIDERYRFLSNYVDDVSFLKNFDRFCENPTIWNIDKDIIDPNNRKYYYEHLSIVYYKDNLQERNNRCGCPFTTCNIKYHPTKHPILGISLDYNKVLIYKAITDIRKDKFDTKCVSSCIKHIQKYHKGFKWYNINYKHNKHLRVKEGKFYDYHRAR